MDAETPPVEVKRTTGRPRTHHEAKRNQIIDVATDLFAARGFDGTSIKQICRAAGVSSGVFYHYLSSKEELLVLINYRHTEPVLESMREIVALELTVCERLRLLSKALINANVRYLAAIEVLQRELRVLRGSPEYRQLVARRREFEQLLVDLLEEGQANGELNDLDPTLVGLAFWGMHNYLSQWYRQDGSISEERIAATFAQLFLIGVTGQPATSAATHHRARPVGQAHKAGPAAPPRKERST